MFTLIPIYHDSIIHTNRPLWVCPDGRFFLESFNPLYRRCYEFLVCIAEPVSRPRYIHEWQLSNQSLYASISVGLDTETIIRTLECFSKVKVSEALIKRMRDTTVTYGKLKIALKDKRYYVESSLSTVLNQLLSNEEIRNARIGTGDFIETDSLVCICKDLSFRMTRD